MRLRAALPLLAAAFNIVLAVAQQGPVRIVPHQQLTGEELFWGQSRVYIVDGLDDGVDYEFRLSYPATTPTDFVLELQSGRANEIPPADPRARRLLNTEKLIFSAKDCDGACQVRLTANYAGVSLLPGLDTRPVRFNIVVEPLIVGVPRDAVRVVLVCVAAVAVAVLAIVPRCDAWLRAAAKPARVKN